MTGDATRQKRILALSGGGVHGVVEVAFLEAIESALQDHLGRDTRICDVFNLIGGTSTGALIAVALSRGVPLEEVKHFYLTRAAAFFQKRRWLPIMRHVAAFDGDKLEAELKAVVGDATLGDPGFRTHCAIVTKRLDTGSRWIISTIDTAPYFNEKKTATILPTVIFRCPDCCAPQRRPQPISTNPRSKSEAV
ncbi:patatin-like phospholipase family protein [Ruegeria halocynthiae]|uniref:patatin-like phospholipase family protein n=1 Tax=Ruegeria halocynthiae TaxID=985054 RepID=UPI001362F2C7|nr:patatin-like phospholipase family protein [Ruegeria halocynthiae]